MQKVKCMSHSAEFSIPNSDEEFNSGKLHEQVENIDVHYKNYPSCKFEVVN